MGTNQTHFPELQDPLLNGSFISINLASPF